MHRSLFVVCLSLFLAACTVPRAPLPTAEQFTPPPEANFHERPEVVHFDPRKPYDPERFTPPRFTHTEPGSNVVSPRNHSGATDAYAYFVVEKDGRVRQVKIVVKTRSPELDDAIERMVLRWRFVAGQLDGQPVAVAMGHIIRLQVRDGL